MNEYSIKERIMFNADEFTNLFFKNAGYFYFNNLSINDIHIDEIHLAIEQLIEDKYLIELNSVYNQTRMFIKNNSKFKNNIIEYYGIRSDLNEL